MSESSTAVPEATATTDETQSDQRSRVVLRLEDANAEVKYANAFQVHSAESEVTVSLGMKLPGGRVNVNDSEGQPVPANQLRVRIDQHLALSYETAKRLSIALGNAVQQHERRRAEATKAPAEQQN